LGGGEHGLLQVDGRGQGGDDHEVGGLDDLVHDGAVRRGVDDDQFAVAVRAAFAHAPYLGLVLRHDGEGERVVRVLGGLCLCPQCGAALRVGVHDRHAQSGSLGRGGYRQRAGGLADPALDVGHADDHPASRNI
jgi:hypothetical protein